MSATRILAGPVILAFSMALAACSTSGINMAAELEAVSQKTSEASQSDDNVTAAGEPVTAEAAAEEKAPAEAVAVAEAAPAPAENTAIRPSFVAAAYAAPSPTSSVQALASAAGAAASSAPRVRLIHPVSNITPREVAARSPELDALIAKYAAHYELPVEMVRQLAHKESTLNPAARNRIYWGLLQIRHDTAQTMGYRGSAEGLLDAETNLNYAVRYLRGAYLTADFDQDRAIRLYQRGYYFDARRKGILHETGLRPNR